MRFNLLCILASLAFASETLLNSEDETFLINEYEEGDNLVLQEMEVPNPPEPFVLLSSAIQSGDLQQAQALMEASPSVRFPVLELKDTLSPLAFAIYQGKPVSVISALAKKTNVNERSIITGKTALHYAVEGSHRDQRLNTEYIVSLLDMGADPNIVDFAGKTAFHYAIEIGEIRNVLIFIRRRATLPDVATCLPHPQLVLEYVKLISPRPCSKLILKAYLRLLLRYNRMAINYCDPIDGMTALHVACLTGRQELIEALLEAGARFTIRDNHGRLAKDCLPPTFPPQNVPAAFRIAEMANVKAVLALAAQANDGGSTFNALPMDVVNVISYFLSQVQEEVLGAVPQNDV